MGSVVEGKAEAPPMKRTLTPEMLNALMDPSLKLDAKGSFSFFVRNDKTKREEKQDATLTKKMANEALRFMDLLGRTDPRSPEAKKRVQGWLDEQPKSTTASPAAKPKWNADKPIRMLAVWNKINDRRSVLVDTSLLFSEGNRAFPVGAVDVRYEKTTASKSQPEVERIVITRGSNPTKEETEAHQARKKKQDEAKARKRNKK
jgi:hypothetical protein